MDPFRVDKNWGPPRLRRILQSIEDRINGITPVPGLGVTVDETPGGMQLHTNLPPVQQGETLSVTNAAGAVFAFALVDASNESDGLRVLVVDGRVNGDYPSGMGFGNYYLSLADESFQAVLLLITYDEETLEITSLTLDVSDDPDDSEAGLIIVQLGFIEISYDSESNRTVKITQRWLGDIHLELIYGAMNGAPALFPLVGISDPIPISDEEE